MRSLVVSAWYVMCAVLHSYQHRLYNQAPNPPSESELPKRLFVSLESGCPNCCAVTAAVQYCVIPGGFVEMSLKDFTSERHSRNLPLSCASSVTLLLERGHRVHPAWSIPHTLILDVPITFAGRPGVILVMNWSCKSL